MLVFECVDCGNGMMCHQAVLLLFRELVWVGGVGVFVIIILRLDRNGL